MPPSVAIAIALCAGERAQLEASARRRTSAQALAQRARIVWRHRRAEEHRDRRAARVSRNMVMTWRARLAEGRLDGLLDEPRPGWPRTIIDEQVEEVIVKTL